MRRHSNAVTPCAGIVPIGRSTGETAVSAAPVQCYMLHTVGTAQDRSLRPNPSGHLSPVYTPFEQYGGVGRGDGIKGWY